MVHLNSNAGCVLLSVQTFFAAAAAAAGGASAALACLLVFGWSLHLSGCSGTRHQASEPLHIIECHTNYISECVYELFTFYSYVLLHVFKLYFSLMPTGGFVIITLLLKGTRSILLECIQVM